MLPMTQGVATGLVAHCPFRAFPMQLLLASKVLTLHSSFLIFNLAKDRLGSFVHHPIRAMDGEFGAVVLHLFGDGDEDGVSATGTDGEFVGTQPGVEFLEVVVAATLFLGPLRDVGNRGLDGDGTGLDGAIELVAI